MQSGVMELWTVFNWLDSAYLWVKYPSAKIRLFLMCQWPSDFVDTVCASWRLPPLAAAFNSETASFLEKIKKKRRLWSLKSRRVWIGVWKYLCCTTAFFLLPSCGRLLFKFHYFFRFLIMWMTMTATTINEIPPNKGSHVSVTLCQTALQFTFSGIT